MIFSYKPATTSSFAYTDTLYNSLQNDIAALTQYKNAVMSGVSPTQAFDTYMREASLTAQEFANSVNAATISEQNYKTHLMQMDVANQAQNRSLSNCKVLIDEYQTGLQNCGLTQEQYTAAIQKSNPQLAQYLMGLNGAKATIGGYVGSLVAAKAATIGLRIAQTALNATIGFGLGLVVQFVMSGITKAFEAIKEACKSTEEKMSDLNTKFQEISSKAQETAKNFQQLKSSVADIAPRFNELVKGVNQFGENETLSTDEYQEFLSLGNQLAELFPELDLGIDSNGNHILNLAYSVDTVTESVNALIDAAREAANLEVAGSMGDALGNIGEANDAYEKQIASLTTKRDNYIETRNLLNKAKAAYENGKYDNYGSYKDSTYIGDLWEIITKSGLNRELNITEQMVKDGEWYNIFNGKDFEDTIAEFDRQLKFLEDKQEARWEKINPIVGAWLTTTDQYAVASKEMQNILSKIVGNLDYDEIGITDDGELQNYLLNNIIDPILQAAPGVQQALVGMFNIKSAFDNGDVSLGDLRSWIDAYINEIKNSDIPDNVANEIIEAIKTAVGYTEIEDKGTFIQGRILPSESYSGQDIQDYIEELSSEEIEIVYDIVEKQGSISLDELEAEIKNLQAVGSVGFISGISKAQEISSKLDALSKAYEDVKDGGNFDWSNILNNEDFEKAFDNLASYEDFVKIVANSPDDINATQQAFNRLAAEYINTSGILDNLNDSNKNIIISMLEEAGISNASTIVTQKLAEAKAKLYLQNLLSKQSIDVVISNLGTEASACNMTKAAFANLVAQEVIFNNNNLDVSSKISQLQALAKAAGATSSILANVMDEHEFNNSRRWTNQGYTYNEYLAEMWRRTYNNLNFDVDIPEYNFVGSSSSSGGSSNSSGSSNSEPKTFDWIEIAVNRIESAVDKLKTAASNTYKTITSRLSVTSNAFKKITSEIDIQQKAYNRYMKEANAVGLSSSIAQKVRDGAIDIQEYDEKTQELISDYQDWYEKALDASDAVDELKNSLSELYEEKFDLINANFENQLSDLEHQANTYENKLSILEAQGFSASVNYYSALERISKSQISSLEKQYDELQKTLSEAVSSGKIEKYSEAWYDMQNDIVAVDEAIQDATLSMYEYQKSIQELNWENFDRMQDNISAITDETDFLSELLENSDMFNDKGKITSNGIAQMGLYASSYSVYMSQAKKYADEVRKIENELADSPGNTDLIDRKNELIDLQREAISSALEEKQAIADLVSEGIEKELSALQELIDEYSNALESAKDLHDYQKKVAEYSDSISSIEKQLMAYSGDDSEEARKKIQELKVDLNETQEDLKDAEYDRYISEQKSLLDSIYTEYETLLNSRLDDIDNLLSEAISISDKHTDEIKGTINNAASSVGYSISETMQHIWEEGTSSGSIDSAIDSTINSISTKLGDVDLDGKITAADSRLALKFSAGIIDLTDEQLIAADANQDGIITAADARLILQAAAQLLDLDKIQGFSSGGMVDGLKSVVKSNNDDYITINTLKKGEAVLTPEQTLDFKKFVDELPRLTYLTDTSTLLSHIRGNTNINRSTEIGKIDINIPIEHVSDYNDFVNQLRKDNKFENLIRSMSVDLLSGKSTLSKNKYKW